MKNRLKMTYKGYTVEWKYKQWYSNDFKGSFKDEKEFRSYINGRISRGNLKAN